MLNWLLVATLWCKDTKLLLVYFTFAFQTGSHIFVLGLVVVKQQQVGLLLIVGVVLLPAERSYPNDRGPPWQLLLLHRCSGSLRRHRVLAVTK